MTHESASDAVVRSVNKAQPPIQNDRSSARVRFPPIETKTRRQSASVLPQPDETLSITVPFAYFQSATNPDARTISPRDP